MRAVPVDELADLNERETGKTADDALGGVHAGVDTLRQYAELGPLHRRRSLHGEWSATEVMVPEPRGVVAVPTPWNDPVAVPDCSVQRFAEIVVAHLRGGVLEILDGDGSVGARLSAAEEVDVVAQVPARSVSRWNVSTSSRRSSGRRPAA